MANPPVANQQQSGDHPYEVALAGVADAVIVALIGVLLTLALMPEQESALTLSGLTMLVVFGALWAHRNRWSAE